MEDKSQSEKPNPNLNLKTKSNSANPKTKKKAEFEFCKVCNRNHDEGQRHKYFPSHTKSLSTFLSKLQTKITEIRFFLKNPTLLRSEHASRNRFWCVVCDSDIDELGSAFACNNAINHLASVDHLKNLKHFMWKYGGGMNRVDAFRILEADVAKWEKKCNSLRTEAASSGEGSWGLLSATSNGMSIRNSLSNGTNSSGNVYPSSERVSQDERVVNREISSQGLLNLTQISSKYPPESGGNVHSGAPPPWLETEGDKLKPVLSGFVSSSNKPGKSKLNPKRVGAAWAEKRKMEMEMEKRGEIVKSDFDSNWLPNFGRVWQSGTRKESRKEFEIEKQKQPKAQNHPEMPMKIQPYISKRMRRDAGEDSNDPHVND